jgi:uncharacterized OB-fold protein
MSVEWERSLPNISSETAAFWAACRQDRLIVQRCRACHKYQTYYRGFCCHCWERDLEDVFVSGDGIIWTYTVTHSNRTPGWQDHVPYILAAIELTEGVKLVSNVINCAESEIRVGLPVRVTFVQATDEVKLPYFEPAAVKS